MKLNKNQVHILNTIAKVDFEKANLMLNTVNLLFETSYGWLNNRVTRFDDCSSVSAMYATAHDVWAETEE